MSAQTDVQEIEVRPGVKVRAWVEDDRLRLVVDADEPDPDKRREIETEVGLALTRLFQTAAETLDIGKLDVASLAWEPDRASDPRDQEGGT